MLVDGGGECMVFTLDTEGRVACWNAGVESVTGYRAEEIVGQHFSRLYTPDG